MAASDNRSAVRERLRKLFDVEFEQHGERWDVLWQNKDLPFDRGTPNPALVDTLSEKGDLLGPPTYTAPDGVIRRKRALVPGCGRGYDVLLLACHGYDASGIEISPEAIKACKEFAGANVAAYAANTGRSGRGKYEYVSGDFFVDEWREGIGEQHQRFDLIYDYTVSCHYS